MQEALHRASPRAARPCAIVCWPAPTAGPLLVSRRRIHCRQCWQLGRHSGRVRDLGIVCPPSSSGLPGLTEWSLATFPPCGHPTRPCWCCIVLLSFYLAWIPSLTIQLVSSCNSKFTVKNTTLWQKQWWPWRKLITAASITNLGGQHKCDTLGVCTVVVYLLYASCAWIAWKRIFL